MPGFEMRSQLIAPALQLVQEAGADPRALIERFQLPSTALTDPEVTLPLQRLHQFFDAAAEAANDPFLGAHIAARYPRGRYGLMEFTSRTAPTLRDACERIARYIALSNELVEISLTEEHNEASITQRIEGVPTCVGRHANEFFACVLVLQAREVTDVPIVPERVQLAHPAPSDVSLLHALFGTTHVSFHHQANTVVLRSSLLELPLRTSDPPLNSLLQQHAEQALSARSAPRRWIGRIRQQLRDQLEHGAPTIESFARELGLSVRTLQRRLGDEGSTFQQLLDSVREELARLQVGEGKIPLTEIALSLGYAEQGAFFRAFKRWTGTTPNAFRKAYRPKE